MITCRKTGKSSSGATKTTDAKTQNNMSILPNLPFFWIGFISGLIFLALWQHVTGGRTHCIWIFFGHVWAVLKEEVARPLRVIKKALSRGSVRLDDTEDFYHK